ncbi:MAG TPA: DCC1-like thiol-disulfide oxidoreductase family protein [Kiritimatiellia bacterium]|nr:DCC1-like thiol-disulfide oxidoreductase family protein [Kiritimatiellia bacterium]
MNDRPVVLFDGECGLCSRSVRFILRHERNAWCRFAALQSEAGRGLALKAGYDPASLDSLLVLAGGRLLLRSEAVLHIASHLRWPWRAVQVFRALPGGFRDVLYNWVARNRFRLFGRHEYCSVPQGLDRARFIA